MTPCPGGGGGGGGVNHKYLSKSCSSYSSQLFTKGIVTFSRTLLRATLLEFLSIRHHLESSWSSPWDTLEQQMLVRFSHRQLLGGKLFELFCPFIPGIRNCIIHGKTGVNKLPTKISQTESEHALKL